MSIMSSVSPSVHCTPAPACRPARTDRFRWASTPNRPEHAAVAECLADDLPGSEFSEPTAAPDEEDVWYDDILAYLAMQADDEADREPEEQELAELGIRLGLVAIA